MTSTLPPLRILLVTNLYPRPGYESNAAFHRRLVLALRGLGHEVRVIAPLSWTQILRPLEDTKGTGTKIPPPGPDLDGTWVDRPVYFFTPRILSHAYGAMFARSIAGAFRRLVASSRPDVVLGSWAHPDGWAAVRLARKAGLPSAILAIGSDILVATRDPRRRARIVEGLRAADRVLVVSRDLAGSVERLGIDPGKVDILHTGVDPSVFRPGDRREARRTLGLPEAGDRVGYVGNLYLSKGPGVLLDALAILKAGGTRVEADLVGGGADGPALRARAAELGLDRVVHFRGRVDPDALPAWYRSSDLIALPSDSEGIPNVLREATACGIPWVASRVGGIPEIADPAVDRLVPPRDPRALASAIAGTLEARPDPAASPTRVPCPTWDDSARTLAASLRTAISTREGAQR